MREKVLKEVQKTIKEKYNKNVELETILTDTGIDSLDLLDLVVEIEEKHNVKITDEELIEIKTVKDIVEAISTKQN